MLDWITITLELIGIAILLMWIVIPIKEFREIFRIVSRKHAAAPIDEATDKVGGKAGPLP